MKKNMNNIISWVCTGFILSIFIVSCSSMDDYKDFTKGGEISYTGKIDSVTVFSGDERVLIEGLFMSDPKIANCRIYWNNDHDSLNIPVIRTEGIDTLKKFIPLPENLYNFKIYTYDALGNKSVAVYATGRSYGTSYKASINNRLIISAIADANNDVTVGWRDIDKTLGAFATDVSYMDNANKQQKVRVDIDVSTSVLKNYKKGTTFSYQTLYRPDTLCIDTFHTVAQTHSTAFKIDKSTWIATADTYELTGQMPNGGPPSFTIDDDPNTYWHTAHTTGTTPYPHWLAYDMGKEVAVDVVELTSRYNYINADFKDFLIEGRNSLDEEWTSYGSYTLPDILGPQQFLIPDSPKMRYVRIYMLNGGSPPHSHLAEFSVYGNYVN
ncbi:F5/8 type C domain-containing protein [bacterium A37T11]|nr:F5/8 type C domain-containing protein [bacterium A37T11]